jgi:nucleoside-diphosphate-sugar epimerase
MLSGHDVEFAPVRVVVTGAAGFIGSHVAEAVAAAGHEVVAVDKAVDKAVDTAVHNEHAGIVRMAADLAVTDPPGLAGASTVIHLAGRPGVRCSWGDGTAATRRDNVETTRRLLAACRAVRGQHPRVILASSSSVYGSAELPCNEDDDLRPESPYGHAKVAAEELVRAAARDGLETVILRYFSVYGPRQRPDMAFHRFIEAALTGAPVPVYGDGTQSRAFTFVGDVVEATLAAMTAELPPGVAINVGHPVTVRIGVALHRIGVLVGGSPPEVTREAPARGDVTRTWASTERAQKLLGWTARTDLDEGLKQQIAWHRETS